MLDLKLPHQHCQCFYLSVVGILGLWFTHIGCLCKLHAKPTKVKINTMQQKTILGGNVAFLHLLNIKNSSKKVFFLLDLHFCQLAYTNFKKYETQRWPGF